MGLFRGHGIPRHHKLFGPGYSDHPRQSLRTAGPGDNTDLDLRCPDPGIFRGYSKITAQGQLEQYAKVMREHRVKPECEIYDFGGIYNILMIRKQGIFEEPMHFQMVFGLLGGVPYDLFNIAREKELLPQGASWSVCGVGPYQFSAGMTAAVNGGHIRVGLEDNIRMPDRKLAKGSYAQVRWAAEVARLAGREVASPDDARKIFHIPERA